MSNDQETNEIKEQMKEQIGHYRTRKILMGQGLDDEPEWIARYEGILN